MAKGSTLDIPVMEYAGKFLAERIAPKAGNKMPSMGPHEFIFTCCYTIDEADPAEKIKLIPDLPHTRLLIQRVLIDRLHPLLLPKSRRMIISWTLTACEVYKAMYNEHSGIFVQSKKFDDSAELVNRHWEMIKAIPKDIMPVESETDDGITWACGLSVKRYKGGRGHTAKLEFSNGSYIQALAEGKDQLRQFGASIVRQEEIAFWDRQEESYDAAIECTTPPPGASHGGQLIAVSTANPSWFGQFVHDEEVAYGKKRQKGKLNIKRVMEGVREWTTSLGANVLEIHYKADPAKRNPEWIKEAKKGKRPRGWDREMEIKWDVYQGMPVFGDCFNADIHISKEPITWDGESIIMRCWDYGNTPAVTFSTLSGGRWLWLGEICTDTRPMGSKEPPPTSNISRLADDALVYCAQRFPGATFMDVDDPAGDQRSQTDSRSCRDILSSKGIHPIGGEVSTKGRIEAMANWLSKLVNGQPAVLIDEAECPMLIEGMKGGYRYAEIGQTGRFNDTPEKNQFSHPIDAQCYGASRLHMMPECERDEYNDVPDYEYYERSPNRSGAYY